MPRFVHKDRIHAFETESALTESGVGLLFGTADGQVDLPGSGDAGAANIAGIFVGDSADANSTIEVVREGFVDVRVNGNSVAIARGDKLKIVATTGRFVKAASDGDYYFLEAQEAATADGVLISALIVRGFRGA